MIIGVCGYGFTGSGAVLDILKGCEELEVIDSFELSIAYYPDGVDDLTHKVYEAPTRYVGCDRAIKRFLAYIQFVNNRNAPIYRATHGKMMELTKAFVNEITQVQWEGTQSMDQYGLSAFSRIMHYSIPNRIERAIENVTHKRIAIMRSKTMRLSIRPDNYMETVKKYMMTIINEMRMQKEKTIVLNQPFSGNDPTRCFKYFDDPRAIVVDRDPRDLYVLAKRVQPGRARFIPSDDVHNFIEYYRAMRQKSCHGSAMDDVLELRFEDIIYKYAETLARISAFIGVHVEKGANRYFDIEKSKHNTMMYTGYPELANDIAEIEKQLGEYLYPHQECADRVNGDNYLSF